MNDRTITRASRRGIKTAPITKPHPTRTTIRSDIRLTAEEMVIALVLAEADRTEESIQAYARTRQISKGVAA